MRKVTSRIPGYARIDLVQDTLNKMETRKFN
jgi:hypothetical protein